MGRVKKYIKKQARRAGGWAKKRYAPGGKLDVGRIVKDVAILKNAINVEHKYSDYAHASTTTVAGTPYIANLTNVITQGTGSSSARIGQSIKINYAQFAIRFERNATSVTGANMNTFRVMLVLDKEPLAGAFSITDLLTSNNVTAFRNFTLATSGRYKILKDWTYTLDGIKTNTVNFKYFRRMETKVKYDSSTGVVNNNLYFIVMSDAPLGTNEFGFTGISRLKYVDN